MRSGSSRGLNLGRMTSAASKAEAVVDLTGDSHFEPSRKTRRKEMYSRRWISPCESSILVLNGRVVNECTDHRRPLDPYVCQPIV